MPTQAPTDQSNEPADGTFSDQTSLNNASTNDAAELSLRTIAIDLVVANPQQPRQHINDDTLRSLAESISEHGILQPPTVHALPNGTYQLIAGERRIRAARQAGLTHVPVIVRATPTLANQVLLALIENTQRQDLTPLEKAHAYAAVQHAAEQATGRRIGVRELGTLVDANKDHVQSHLHLLQAPPDIQHMVAQRHDTVRVANELMKVAAAADRAPLIASILAHELSQSEVIRAVQGLLHSDATTNETPPPDDDDFFADDDSVPWEPHQAHDPHANDEGDADTEDTIIDDDTTMDATGDMFNDFDDEEDADFDENGIESDDDVGTMDTPAPPSTYTPTAPTRPTPTGAASAAKQNMNEQWTRDYEQIVELLNTWYERLDEQHAGLAHHIHRDLDGLQHQFNLLRSMAETMIGANREDQ